MGTRDTGVPASLVRTIDDCASMIRAAGVREYRPLPPAGEPFSSLLEQCRRLTDRLPAAPEPIRTLHHFACTGGTLIAKCLACMPNTQLLSEVEPFSYLHEALGRGRFHPTDLVRLLRSSSRGGDAALEGKIFLAGLDVLYRDCEQKGLRLVLRDHAHSRYCVGALINDEAPALRELLQSVYPTRSILTVRHPLDSFLSLAKLGWLHFTPATLEAYCSRYARFLDDYEDVPVFRYEEFIEHPEAVMRSMCEALDLPFADGFRGLFSAHRLSGDSGRSSDVIAPRARRPVPDALAAEAGEPESFLALCRRLGYPAS